MSLGEKTHKPTRKRISKAEKEGQFLYSQEFTHSLAVLALSMGITLIIKNSWVRIERMVNYTLVEGYKFPQEVAMAWALELFSLVGAILLVFSSVAVIAQLLQRGFVLRFNWPCFKVSRLSPSNGIKQIISGIRSIGWSSVKVVLAMGILIEALRCQFVSTYKDLLSYEIVTRAVALPQVASAILWFVVLGVIAFIVCGVIDYILKRREYFSQLSMSRDEIVREQREEDGDPLLRAHRKAMHRGYLMQDLISRVRRSRVILVAPKGEKLSGAL